MPGKYLPLICFIIPVQNLIPFVFVKDIRKRITKQILFSKNIFAWNSMKICLWKFGFELGFLLYFALKRGLQKGGGECWSNMLIVTRYLSSHNDGLILKLFKS